MMGRTAVALAVAAITGVPAAAQDYDQLAYYLAWIGPEDMQSSSGVRITDLGGALQQDRANVHRFGIRHADDSVDPIFAEPAQRARLPELYRAGIRLPGLEERLRAGEPFGVGVFVCGSGGTPTVIYLAPFGSDHSGCF